MFENTNIFKLKKYFFFNKKQIFLSLTLNMANILKIGEKIVNA